MIVFGANIKDISDSGKVTRVTQKVRDEAGTQSMYNCTLYCLAQGCRPMEGRAGILFIKYILDTELINGSSKFKEEVEVLGEDCRLHTCI